MTNSVTPTPRRRFTRSLALLAGGLALVVAAPVATAATASAATTTTVTKKITKKSSRTTFHLSKRTQTHGKTAAKLRTTVTVGSKHATGRVVVKDGTHKLRTLTLHKGVATYRLPSSLKVGAHRIVVRYLGSSSAKGSASAHLVHVKKGTPKVVTVAKEYVGKPYRHGASGPKAFDCSGFTRYVYKKAGIKTLSHSSSVQRHQGKKISRSAAKPGDLIWTPGHVAIYLGGNKQIDAPRPGKTIQVRAIWQSHPTFIRVSSKAVSA
ncbi:C40 family peptidase [Cellulomonas sp. HZM]|uniref:C40 family peptidase n=1 Tax=Cellulomonas sp. HZM TaxID=1454010 RepID=UPI00069101A6|nr:C40 family peptidase [Cellulomonas sp. HZM]